VKDGFQFLALLRSGRLIEIDPSLVHAAQEVTGEFGMEHDPGPAQIDTVHRSTHRSR